VCLERESLLNTGVRDGRGQQQPRQRRLRAAFSFGGSGRASRIRVRAERKLGEILKRMAETGERATRESHGRGIQSSVAPRDTRTLDDLGIPRDRASRAMQLADVPEEQFEAALAEPAMAQQSRRILRRNPRADSRQKKNCGGGTLLPPDFLSAKTTAIP
jgi:hypothetical protein